MDCSPRVVVAGLIPLVSLAIAALGLPACGAGGEGERTGSDTATSFSTLSAGTTLDTADATSGSGSASQTGTGTPGTTAIDDTGPSADTVQITFDVGQIPDGGGNPCGGGKGGDVEFSYIWVANSSQNAVSKINTQTMIEEGRYLVHPGNGNPSRTSVSLSGDVAIANRNGGITKIYANHADCPDINGMAGLQTSSGGADVLAWDLEECRAWHTPMAYSTQRPVAWSPGTFNPAACAWEGQMVWTASAQSGAAGSVVVTVLDGETGVVDSEVPIPEIAIGFFGPYGAAFDTNGDFWFVDSGNDGASQELVRVDAVTLDYDIWMTPAISPYGFTVDTLGRPWIAGYAGGIARFDPVTETFDVNNAITGLGIQEDANGVMWMAHYPWDYEGVIAIDRDSMAVIDQIDLPSSLAKGVSIDFYGYVWVVDQGTSAFRIDPATESIDTFTGLVGPYTYSDMTGWGLSSVSNPEG
jgi:streptogramin lyase